MRDYLLILRERIWVFIITFFIIALGVAMFTLHQQPLYRANTKVEVLRSRQTILPTNQSPMDVRIQGMEDFNTQLQKLTSTELVEQVALRIRGDEESQLLAPYQSSRRDITVSRILGEGLRVSPVRASLVIEVGFVHPDPTIARNVSIYFAEEFINLSIRKSLNDAMGMIEELRQRVENQRQQVEAIRNEIVNYVERTGFSSLNRENNVDSVALQQFSSMKVQAESQRDDLQSKWSLIQETLAAGRPLHEVPFIGSLPRVQSLLGQLSTQRITINALRQRYRDRHPALITEVEVLSKIQQELDEAITDAIRQVEVDYQDVQQRVDRASLRLAQKEREITDINRSAVQYRSLEDRLMVAQNQFTAMEMRLREQTTAATMIGANALILDKATRPQNAFSPNYVVNFGLGIFGGVGLGLGLVFVIALLDDRIKSAYDVETAVGLPLLGIIPRIKRMNSSEKAQAVASNRERRITESFRAVHSALRVNEAAKAARVILVTSTSPSEGKSFVVTNLALTFAVHGERILVVDCDLRMPNIGKSIAIPEDTMGVTQVFKQEVSLKDAIVKDVYPNLDVLTAGRRSDNPTQIFTSAMFEQMIDQLADRYDRIIMDSPPIAAVSDVLTLLPFVDGVIYVVKFNAVKRKSARAQVRRIIESNTPVFGAVLNQISTAVASYYYSGYYSKSYANYGANAATPEETESLEPEIQKL